MKDPRWSTLRRFCSLSSDFGNETGLLANGEYEPSADLFDRVRSTSRILVIGAGGLGCEILKDLAMLGFQYIDVIDMDTIDLTNLNRQFLFRKKDIGQSKAKVASEFIANRVDGCIVTPHFCKIQDKDETFYRQFNIIISGLDNIEARRWLNSLLVNMIQFDSDGEIKVESIIPLIDGGTEGFNGQARVILPRITSCFECSIESFPPQKNFPMCTIAETPRLPEHCIAYAYMMEWDRVFPDKKLDKDEMTHMQWIYERALERATTFGIEGVTYFKTLGVVKNIIPAIASTNCIIAACCVNEAFKLLTFASQTMNTYYMYMGSQGIYTTTFEYGKLDGCIVCGDASVARSISIPMSMTLREFIDKLCNDPILQLKKPSLTGESMTLYMTNPPSLEESLRPNLNKYMSTLVQEEEVIIVTDRILSNVSLNIKVKFVTK